MVKYMLIAMCKVKGDQGLELKGPEGLGLGLGDENRREHGAGPSGRGTSAGECTVLPAQHIVALVV